MTKFDELQTSYPVLIPVNTLRASVSIVELAIHHGYEIQPKKGRSRPVLQHPTYQDVIIIKNPADASQQLYQRAGNFADAGTIIDFIRHRLDTVFAAFNHPGESAFRNATCVLYDYLRIDPQRVRDNREITIQIVESSLLPPFTKEHFDLRPLEKTNYLHQRHITPQTLGRPEFVDQVVTQVTYFNPDSGHADSLPTVKEHPERTYLTFHNVAFPYYNGLSTEVTGLELRNKQLKGHAPGSDRLNSVFVSNPPPVTERFYVLESTIDALSHRQLRSQGGEDAFDSVYFSTGGQPTPQQVGTITRYIAQFTKSPDWQLRLAFDNDTKGHLYDLQFIQQLLAPKFPLRSIAVGLKAIGYQLPGEDTYRPLQAALLEQIVTYNRGIENQMPPESGSVSSSKRRSGLIAIRADKGAVFLSIPEVIEALSAVSRILLALTPLGERIGVEKSSVKDFNQELMDAASNLTNE